VDWNAQHSEIKAKICRYCRAPGSVSITGSATTHLGQTQLTKMEVLDAVHEHVSKNRRVYSARMDNGDTVYVITNCDVQGIELYVKVRLVVRTNGKEYMLIMSAHTPRRW
jgi:hypothetical protein